MTNLDVKENLKANKSSFICELKYQEANELFKLFANSFGSCFLDSSLKNNEFGRYSYIAFDPLLYIKIISGEAQVFIKQGSGYKNIINKKDDFCPFELLRLYLNKYNVENIDGVPPFQGGFCGYFGYELYQYLEKIPFSNKSIGVPDLVLGLYDNVISFDHIYKKSWIISNGLILKTGGSNNNCLTLSPSIINAQKNIDKTKEIIAKKSILSSFDNSIYDLPKISDKDIEFNNQSYNLSQLKSNLFNKVKTKNIDQNYKLYRNFNKKSYVNAVKLAKEKILNGDIFEVNISQQFFITNYNKSLGSIYESLRRNNPAPFSCFLNFNVNKN